MNSRLVTGVLLAVDALLVLVATKGWAQDFLPYYTGAQLALAGQAGSVMLPADATHLMDSSQVFIEQARAASGANPRGISGLVSAPPALVPALLLCWLPYPVASLIWKVLGAVTCAASLHALHGSLPEARRSQAAWLALLLLPGMAYCVLLGQTTPLLVATAAFSAARYPRIHGVFLGLAGTFKLAPLVLLADATRTTRRIAIAVVVALVGLSLALPLELWEDFARTALHLSSHTTPTPENVSIEAGLLRWTRPPSVDLLPIGGVIWAVGAALRLVAAAVFARALVRRAGTRGAGWVLVLWMTPLSWSHYLLVLPFAAQRWRLAIAALVALPHLGVFLRPPGLGTLGTVVALTAGVVVLIESWTAPTPATG